MKALITIAALTLVSLTSMADYRMGRMQNIACGKNTSIPAHIKNGDGYVSGVCRTAVQGMTFKTPLLAFDHVNNIGKTTTYVFAQVGLRMVNYAQANPMSGQVKAMLTPAIDLQIVGTVVNGMFNRINFVRAPDIVTMYAGLDKQNNVTGLSGYLSLVGDATRFPVRVPQLAVIYYAQ